MLGGQVKQWTKFNIIYHRMKILFYFFIQYLKLDKIDKHIFITLENKSSHINTNQIKIQYSKPFINYF